MDVVRVFETYCNDNNISFHYGGQDHLNLIENDIDSDKIYLLLFPVRRRGVIGGLKDGISRYQYQAKFMLMVASDFANYYFNEGGQDQNNSKYTQNIEPLIETHKDISRHLGACDGYDVDQWDCVDATDVMDANRDGLWCDFQLTEY